MIKTKIPKKTYIKDYGGALSILVTFGVILVVFGISKYLGKLNQVVSIVLSDDGVLASSLFSILYTSLAVVLAISANTHKLSSENTKWYTSLSSLIEMMRDPIIVSMSLIFLCTVGKVTYRISDNPAVVEYFCPIIAALVLFLNTYLILITAKVSLEMIAYAKAELGSEKSKTHIPFVVINNLSEYADQMVDVTKRLHKSTDELSSSIVDIYGQVYKHEKLTNARSKISILATQTSRLIAHMDISRDDIRNAAERKNITDEVLSTGFSDIHLSVIELNDLNKEMNEQISELQKIKTVLTNLTEMYVIVKSSEGEDDDKCTEINTHIFKTERDMINILSEMINTIHKIELQYNITMR